MARVRAERMTDNVVDLMVAKLRELPRQTQEALSLAAHIGAIVDGRAMADVLGRDPEPVLDAAVEEDLMLRIDHSCRFPHDRVQEAAYSLVPESDRAGLHLEIGRRLWARTPPAERGERTFEIATQLNLGASLIASPEERERVAEINLSAGKRAKDSAAYASALTYLTAGCALLSEDSWQERYELTFALELNRAECEHLSGDSVAAERRLVRAVPARADPRRPRRRHLRRDRDLSYLGPHPPRRRGRPRLPEAGRHRMDATPDGGRGGRGVRAALASARRPFHRIPRRSAGGQRPRLPGDDGCPPVDLLARLDHRHRTCTIWWSGASPGSASRTETATPRAWPMSAWRRCSGAASATTRRGSGSASSGSIWSSSTASRVSRQPCT